MQAATVEPRNAVRSHLIVFGVLVAVVIALHIPYLSLPYFWDELGQFVPAALDIFHDHAWVPHSTVPNVHPPGVVAYLAFVWSLFGYSVAATRVAMLLVAALGVYVTFLVAIHLGRRAPGAPAFLAAGLLIATPIFYTQAMMAQLDMPAMTFTVIAVLLFLRREYVWCAAACVLLVLAKETGAVAPALFAAWLLRERKWREAVWFVAPFVALAIWIYVLWSATGNILGDPGFAHYNVGYSLQPVRFAATLLRRLYYLFLVDFRWIGTIAIVYGLRKTRLFHTRAWLLISIFVTGHILLVSAFGGAELERYLLPVFPFLYVAIAIGLASFPAALWRNVGQAALLAGLLAGLYWNPPFPFPLENNLAMVDFVQLQEAAAKYLDRTSPQAAVASAWPYTGALRNPAMGFTDVGYKVVETSDFHRANVISACRTSHPDVLIVYSRTWEPRWGVLGNRLAVRFLRKYYDYEPQISADEVESELGMHPVLRWEQRGQWIEVFRR